MIPSKLLSLSTMALVPLALSAPTAEPEWAPVAFKDTTIYVNSAAIAVVSSNPKEKARRALLPRESDYCDGTTVNYHPPPFANTADCIYIRDCKSWVFEENAS